VWDHIHTFVYYYYYYYYYCSYNYVLFLLSPCTEIRDSDSLGVGRSGVRIPAEARFSAPVYTGPEDHPGSYTIGTGSFPGVKRPGRGVDHPPPSSVEVKEKVQQYLYFSSGPLSTVLRWILLFLWLPYTVLDDWHLIYCRGKWEALCIISHGPISGSGFANDLSCFDSGTLRIIKTYFHTHHHNHYHQPQNAHHFLAPSVFSSISSSVQLRSFYRMECIRCSIHS